MTSQPPAAPPVEEPRSAGTPWTWVDILLVFVFGLLGAIVVGSFIYPILDRLSLTDTTLETILMLVIYGALGVAAWAIIIKRRGATPADVGLTRVPGSTLWLMIPAAFAVMMVNGFLVLLVRELLGDVATVEDQLDIRGETIDMVETFFFFLSTTIAAPFVEEVFFRGLVYRYAREKAGVGWATFISAALFSAAHAIPTLLAPLFFLGLALAYVAQRYDSLLPAMAMHAVVNLTAVTLLVVEYA
jgi:membrane protease YdiL (CAAX protease family)